MKVKENCNALAFTIIFSFSSHVSSWFPLSLIFGWTSLVLRLANWDKGGDAPKARLIDLCSSIFRDGTCLLKKTNPKTLIFERQSWIFPCFFVSAWFHQQCCHMTLLCLPPFCLPASMTSRHTLLHPSRLQLVAGLELLCAGSQKDTEL